MGLKFPSIRPEEGEIVEPDDLNQNLKPFVDEVNGNLTHENLSNFDLTEDMFTVETFNEVFQSSLVSSAGWDVAGSGFVCSKQTSAYVRVDENDKKMPLINFVAKRDGWIICDFTASFVWKGTGLLNETEAKRLLLVNSPRPIFLKDDTHYLGHESTLPPGGWNGIVGDSPITSVVASYPYDVYPAVHPESKAKVKVMGSAAGVETEARLRDFPQGKWFNTPIDRYAIKFRVLSNGVEICESGWIYNGTDKNAVYLTGAIPVRAGRNEIRTEVSAGMLQSIYGTDQGVRAKDGQGKKGKFFPNSFYSSRDVAMPLPRSYSKKLKIRSEKISNGESAFVASSIDVNYGIDCTVNASNLLIQFRKG